MKPSEDSVRGQLRLWGLNAMGVTMFLSVPAIWLSFSGWALLLILGIGIGAACMYCLLYSYEEGGPLSLFDWNTGTRARVLDARTLEDLSNLGPWIYHHGVRDADFQRTLDELKAAVARRSRP